MLKNKLSALTIFLGSFLIFGVQPMLGRTLLPAFGGTSAVWTTCLATYQVLLLVGYWYAHVVAGRGQLAVGSGSRQCSVISGEEHRTSNIERSTLNAQRLTSNEEITSDTNALTHYRTNALHIVLLGVAVAWVAGFGTGRPWLMAHIGNSDYPALEVLLCVLAFAGLPYVLLSANATLVQAWVAGEGGGSREEGGDGRECSVNSVQCSVSSGEEHRTSNIEHPTSNQRTEDGGPRSEGTNALTHYRTNALRPDVYALYAVSNAGSLLGLLCYPFLVEPFLSLDAQWYGFAGALAAYGGLLGVLARGMQPQNPQKAQRGEEQGSSKVEEIISNIQGGEGGAHPTSNPGTEGTENTNALTNYRTNALLWLTLPATSTFLLNAVTAHLSTDVTPIPLLWVALLAAFLVSYIIGFSKIGEKGVLVWCVLGMNPLIYCAYALGWRGGDGFMLNLVPGLVLMLVGCTFLHGWLYSIRPEERLLTRYYLCLAAGGAIGGLLSGLVAPLVFTRVVEYPIVLVAVALLSAWYAWRKTRNRYRWAGVAVQVFAGVVIFYVCDRGLRAYEGRTVMMRERNFYGCLVVTSQLSEGLFGEPIQLHRLSHGQTLHGEQFQSNELRDQPTTYYGAVGGGMAVLAHPSYTNNTPMNVGLIGLGAGTMACWGRTNDTYRFFEINPQVVDVAWNTNYFTYLSESRAAISVALGDARRMLTAETNRYDVLVIDAYSGDSIPFHLATKEAFQLYFDRLKPGGILAMHITNWHLDLKPLCKAVAKEWNLQLTGVDSEEADICFSAMWVFICDCPLPVEPRESVSEIDWEQVRDIALTTDACGSLINLISYRD